MPFIPPYLRASLPPSAVPIDPPPTIPQPAPSQKEPSPDAHLPFPPSQARAKATSSSLGLGLPSISTNVSDLLLSSLLPPNLPKIPSGGRPSGVGVGGGTGGPRELTTQREGLSVPVLSNNFRRFVTRVGPIFWLQDRVEEVVFWRKPVWTWGWMLAWVFICFQPRVLLLLPSLGLIVLLLHIHERNHPLPSLLGIIAPAPLATTRVEQQGSDKGQDSPDRLAYTSTTTRDEAGQVVGVPAVPPKEAESGVDYYMNIQAIQNLMGLVSDAYDYIAPRFNVIQHPSQNPSPTSLPFTHTHLILLLLPPTLLLPLTPPQLLPYLLLPLGLLPPLAFHPNLTPWLLALPRDRRVRRVRDVVEHWLLTDRLPDTFSGKTISQVCVWENERLDPKLPAPGPIPPTAWSSRYLRQGDRQAWIKSSEPAVINLEFSSAEDKEGGGCLWKSTETTLSPEADEGVEAQVLALKPGWEWVPGEEWRVDMSGEWSEFGIDDEGWSYTDDSWQNASPTPYTEADVPNTNPSTSTSTSASTPASAFANASAYGGSPSLGRDMPNLGLRRVTRRRRWWKRVYRVES
ncbi:hypothetical protein L202_02645 [Cryptococcus amylolentus CBS 6039]|uniref:TECPR1-like DysF domain-containing protein n=2 Tax=Cryptococcus amylolentus TaxID=104669 RepID=A0A1E3HVQ0_9TREE|nr:hypothetical protein L202_02645 [Cryptococcus amylolentus CBS 6039]ODN80394.1 hypothetical protein L202_02645 [Cryptococcus amylolentus CBS 6039]ODO09025.1 hypothetical protein I350_02622 [Cryptococcus amylolentus CBS 6273]